MPTPDPRRPRDARSAIDQLLGSSRLDGADFARQNLSSLVVAGSRWLSGCSFAGADMTEIRLSGYYRRCNFRDAVLRGAALRGAQFTGCDFRGADLTGADLTGARFAAVDEGGRRGTPCDLSDAILTGVVLQETWFETDTRLPAEFSASLAP
jgi:uncharacterized protein YjbI with pentapeptide repeats